MVGYYPQLLGVRKDHRTERWTQSSCHRSQQITQNQAWSRKDRASESNTQCCAQRCPLELIFTLSGALHAFRSFVFCSLGSFADLIFLWNVEHFNHRMQLRIWIWCFLHSGSKQQPAGAVGVSLNLDSDGWIGCWWNQTCNLTALRLICAQCQGVTVIKTRTAPSNTPWSLLDLLFTLTGASRSWKFCLWCQKRLY